MPQRTLTGRLVDATRQPLANIDVKVWPGWPTPAGIPDPAADVLMVRRHLHAKTDATGTFTITGLETTGTGELADWCYRMQFTVDQTQADVAFLLPAGSGVAQLADVMLAEVTPGAGQFVVIAGAAEAVAAASRATAAASQAVSAAATIGDTGWVTITLKNGWGGTLRVRTLAGITFLLGNLTGGANNSMCATLPATFRPTQELGFIVPGIDSNWMLTPSSVQIFANGEVNVKLGLALSARGVLPNLSYLI